jgi:hypothetical protein
MTVCFSAYNVNFNRRKVKRRFGKSSTLFGFFVGRNAGRERLRAGEEAGGHPRPCPLKTVNSKLPRAPVLSKL